MLNDKIKRESNPIEYDKRPWGAYEVLVDSEYTKVKRIFVEPGGRLSYQKHFKREEHWIIVQGQPHITINGKVASYNEGDVIHIPKEALHRIENKTSTQVVFIEVQRGTYFGEDDIVRVEDDYNRS